MSKRPAFAPLLGDVRVIPVLAIERLDDAVPLALALQEGGLHVLEVTLRTPVALAACAAILRACPGVVLGVGTILTRDQLQQSVDIGAQFLVTPGTSETLGRAVAESGVAALPGAATLTEMVTLMEMGFREMKFFPAEAAGGREYLKSVAGPIPELRFCPTGGVTAQNAPDYLALANVMCVGGSWVTPKEAVAAMDWAKITRLAKEASVLSRHG
ncbi:Eda 2-keto-3-deoxy-6-phosphogluconate aldolase [Rhabdaerophilaceae bacterium]